MRSREAFSFLAELEKKGTVFGLKRIRCFLRLLGNPQDSFHSVLIAGSKGKGSTAAMIASILQQAGYKTALYTSPHLVRFNERIQINGKKISGKKLVKLISELKKTMEKQRIPLTHFEFITVLAFKYFADECVDFAVVEVGMGGRLDATNVLAPRVCIITNIEKEHARYLGNSIAKIAFEKAGIIKKGVPLITSERKKNVLKFFKKTCRKKNAQLFVVKKPFEGKIGLLGSFQRLNAALAIAAIKELQSQGIAINKKAIVHGLATVQWPARFEIMQRNPIVVLDCCHTPESARAFVSAFKEFFPRKKAILVIGASSDKNICGIAANISKIAYSVIATEASFRAMPAGKIKKEFETRGKEVLIVLNVNGAVKKAIELAGKRGIVLVAGSCFVAGEAMQLWFLQK